MKKRMCFGILTLFIGITFFSCAGFQLFPNKTVTDKAVTETEETPSNNQEKAVPNNDQWELKEDAGDLYIHFKGRIGAGKQTKSDRSETSFNIEDLRISKKQGLSFRISTVVYSGNIPGTLLNGRDEQAPLVNGKVVGGRLITFDKSNLENIDKLFTGDGPVLIHFNADNPAGRDQFQFQITIKGWDKAYQALTEAQAKKDDTPEGRRQWEIRMEDGDKVLILKENISAETISFSNDRTKTEIVNFRISKTRGLLFNAPGTSMASRISGVLIDEKGKKYELNNGRVNISAGAYYFDASNLEIINKVFSTGGDTIELEFTVTFVGGNFKDILSFKLRTTDWSESYHLLD